MALLLQPTFFAPIIQYVALAGHTDVIFERQDNFQKQTYRNRCYIYGANGRQLLTVPIVHSESGTRQKTKDVKIDTSFAWKKIFIKSLESSYRSSPYFEYYEDDLVKVFEKEHIFLLDLNLHAHEVMSECLEMENNISFTKTYEPIPGSLIDLRQLADAKHEPVYGFNSYTQVFDKKHGFIHNLSILDLLFNEGTSGLQYLEEHRGLLGGKK